MDKKYKVFLGVLILTGVYVWIMLWHARQLKEHHTLTVGTVESCDGGGKGNWGPGIDFSYQADGKKLNGSGRNKFLSYRIISDQVLIGHHFPVLYRKSMLGYDRVMLIAPRDFRNFGYPFPDSLKWVLPWIKEGGK